MTTVTEEKRMSKHTPGPWKVSTLGNQCDIVGPNGEDIGYANSSDGSDEPEFYPVLANAHLIAAAPELLAFAEAFVRHFDGHALAPGDWPLMDTARAAIAKAEGRS